MKRQTQPELNKVTASISRRGVLCLGLSQLISWGVTYYFIGVFGQHIAEDLGWSGELIHSGFSVALLLMGLTSPIIGSFIDARGGRLILTVGSLFNSTGCLILAMAQHPALYFLGWAFLGIGMRATLYDAAFAALVRIGGPGARTSMSQITLLGGLGSTVFWPVGNTLIEMLGWRSAAVCYAFLALITIPLCRKLSEEKYDDAPSRQGTPSIKPLATGRVLHLTAATLFALIVTLTNFLNSGMSAHMIGILSSLGLTTGAAVGIATLRGLGQSLARLCEVVFGHRLHPIVLNVVATSVIPASFVAGLLADDAIAAAAFAFFYGAGNGLVTITRGTLPLVLFDHRSYGALVGRLIVPSFLFSAAAPVIYATVIARLGEHGALLLSTILATTTFAAALLLRILFRPG